MVMMVMMISMMMARQRGLNSDLQRRKTRLLCPTCARMLQLPGVISCQECSVFKVQFLKTPFPVAFPVQNWMSYSSFKSCKLSSLPLSSSSSPSSLYHPAWKRCLRTCTDQHPDHQSPSSTRWWSVCWNLTKALVFLFTLWISANRVTTPCPTWPCTPPTCWWRGWRTPWTSQRTFSTLSRFKSIFLIDFLRTF